MEKEKRAELGEVWTPSKWHVFVDNVILLIIAGALIVLMWKIVYIAGVMSV